MLTQHLQDKNLTQKKRCVYNSFSNSLSANYPKDVLCLYNSEEITLRSKALQISEAKFRSIVDSILKTMKKELLKRKHCKTFVLRTSCNGDSDIGSYGDYIYNDILKVVLRDKNGVFTLHLKNQTIHRCLCFRLSDLIETSYNTNFPQISDFCTLLAGHFSDRNGAVTLFSKNDSRFVYQESSYRKTAISRLCVDGMRNLELTVHVKTDVVDSKKTGLTVVANFVSYLESRLNFFVIAECLKSKVLLWQDHSNFNVQIGKESVVCECYYKACVAVLLEKNVVEDFLSENDIIANPRLQEILCDSKKNRNSILREIKNKKYIKSDFILSPHIYPYAPHSSKC